MAAHVASKKPEMEVSMLLRDDLVCRYINETHINRYYTTRTVKRGARTILLTVGKGLLVASYQSVLCTHTVCLNVQCQLVPVLF